MGHFKAFSSKRGGEGGGWPWPGGGGWFGSRTFIESPKRGVFREGGRGGAAKGGVYGEFGGCARPFTVKKRPLFDENAFQES